MGNSALKQLLAMKRSGEISSDEFALAVEYLDEKPAKSSSKTPTSNESLIWSLSGGLLKWVAGDQRFRQMTPPARWLCTAVMLLSVVAVSAVLVIVAVSLIADWTFNTQIELHPVGSALWTALILAACGWAVGYNRYMMGALAVPLFAGLLLAPMWTGEADNVSGQSQSAWYGHGVAIREMWACRTVEAYNTSMQRMSEARKKEAAAVPGCRSFYQGQEAWVLPGGFTDGLMERTRFEISDKTGRTYEYVTGKDAFRPL